MVVVCDGTSETDERIKRVFKTDPGIGVIRHADAGYKESVDIIKKTDLNAPMVKWYFPNHISGQNYHPHSKKQDFYDCIEQDQSCFFPQKLGQ